MNVEMGDFLMGVPTVIGEDTVAAFGQALRARDLAQCPDESDDLGVGGAGREVVERKIGAFGDDEDVNRGLRVDVVEGEDVRVLIYLPAGYLAA